MPFQLDHEKLDVYQIELQFIVWVIPRIEEVKRTHSSKIREVCHHLDRASLSILFNTAEGNGRRQMKQRARFFDDARGSATECAACLDALVAKGVCTVDEITNGKQLWGRIVAMLSKLVTRFSSQPEVYESSEDYGHFKGKDEDDFSL